MKRSENDVFNDLSKLCEVPGYIHVIAFFCFRDNILGFNKKLDEDDVLKRFTDNRLVRNEISTLIGLMIQTEIDSTNIPDSELIDLVKKTDQLLEEMHSVIADPLINSINEESFKSYDSNPFSEAKYLREPIFYGGESAYSFQYRDLLEDKYKYDEEWLRINKGFTASDMRKFIAALASVQFDKLNSKKEKKSDFLQNFKFSMRDIIEKSDLGEELVKNILSSLTLPKDSRNESFSSISSFNSANAFPILQISETSYVSFQQYTLCESFYENPYFWFLEDKKYIDTAMINRGKFTEEYTYKKLVSVFGVDNVYLNINIEDSSGNRKGEIDILVIYLDIIIICQAKSKKLTIEARKGNDKVLKEDFLKAVQSSYDQAFSCAKFLQDSKLKLFDTDKNEIKIESTINKIYLFCVESEHYPALTTQARHLLMYSSDGKINNPYVMDVFFLDVLTEMLTNPLYFISFVNQRVTYDKHISSFDEFSVLSYHLTNNLWIDKEEIDILAIDQDVSSVLELSMIVRREGIPGRETPQGILTKYNDLIVGKIIDEFKSPKNCIELKIGLEFLKMSEETLLRINSKINEELSFEKPKTIILQLKEENFQIVISFSLTAQEYNNEIDNFIKKVPYYNTYSININKTTFSIIYSKVIPQTLPKLNKIQKQLSINKLGRNDPCYCGSGKKYKKCCIEIN